jgi:hypothetical protein
MPIRFAIIASIFLLSGCGDDSTEPGTQLLLGSFGDIEQHAELTAIHEGAELVVACSGYFSSSDPIELDEDGSFTRRGRWHGTVFGVGGADAAATIEGQVEADHVSLLLRLDEGNTAASTFELQRNVDGRPDEPLCALPL